MMACASPSTLSHAARSLHNSDVSWGLSGIAGLVAHVDSPGAKVLLRAGRRSNPALLVLLDDPDRFVAAHVLLTVINCREGIDTSSGNTYNTLKLDDLTSAGPVIAPDQQVQLRRYWTQTKIPLGVVGESPNPSLQRTIPGRSPGYCR